MKTTLGKTLCDECSATVNSFMRGRHSGGYVDKDLCNRCYKSQLQTQREQLQTLCEQLQTQREELLTELLAVRANISAAAIQREHEALKLAAEAKQISEPAT